MKKGLENPSPDIEKIATSAIRIGGEIFTGITHADAVLAMLEVHTNWSVSMVDKLPIEGGFMTSKRRFVKRIEAGEVARKAKQLEHLDAGTKQDASKSLHAHHIDELKSKLD